MPDHERKMNDVHPCVFPYKLRRVHTEVQRSPARELHVLHVPISMRMRVPSDRVVIAVFPGVHRSGDRGGPRFPAGQGSGAAIGLSA